MMSKIYEKCYACHSGYDCGGTNTLTEEQKKRLEKVLPFIPIPFFSEAYECCLDEFYEVHEGWLEHIPFLEKHGKMMLAMKKDNEESLDFSPFHYNIHEGRVELFWEWEDDNGLYVTEGSMKALWSVDEDDETWSKKETIGLCNSYGVDYQRCDNFMEFLETRYQQESWNI